MLGRAALVTLFILSGSSLFAQTDPLELARGLREMGQPDLSLEYLADLAKKNPPPGVKVLLPLERAQSLLAQAQLESEDAIREAYVNQAKGEFETFLHQNPNHERVTEAKLALAQVTAVQAVSSINRARRIQHSNPDEANRLRNAAIVATRGQFQKAATLFGEAAQGLDKELANPGMNGGLKRELRKASLQAELDRGINQYRLSETYIDAAGPDDQAKTAELDKARKIFQALSRKDDTNPVCWQARAWAAMCAERNSRTEAEKLFKQIKAEGSKTRAGAEGVRMVEFFEAQLKYLDAVENPTKQNLNQARTLVRNWLAAERNRARMTPQRLSMTFYSAFLAELLGRQEIVYEKPGKDEPAPTAPGKMKSISVQGRNLFKEAAREFHKLREFDNEYRERAEEHRNHCIQFIVGENPKEPGDYADPEECQMAALMQLRKADAARAAARKAPEDAELKKSVLAAYDKAIAYLERAQKLLPPNAPPRDVADLKLGFVRVFHRAERYPEAAELGESLARTGRGPTAVTGGLLAIDSYLKHRDRLPPSDDAARQADRVKAEALALHLDKTFPADPATDDTRFLLAALHAQEKHYPQAFAMLTRITPAYSNVAAARAMQGRIAYQLLVGKDSPLSAEEKTATFQQAVADANAVPKPSGGDSLETYFALRTILANLHLARPPAGFADAERIAADNLKQIAGSPLDAADKNRLSSPAEEVRLRAIWGQCAQLFNDGKYPEMAQRMEPSLAEIERAGPAAAAAPEGEARTLAASLDNFRSEFIMLALQGRIREGVFDKATSLLELLDKFGGSIDATTAALNRLVSLVRPQIAELRRQSKGDAADKLATNIGALLHKQAEKPKLPVRVQAALGRSLRDLGLYDKAIEVLSKVPAPAADKLARKTTELDDADREAVVAYQIAQIELIRAHRLLKHFDDAGTLLNSALGTDKEPGWAKSLEFRREAVLLLEEKAGATSADPKDARLQAWADAKSAWETLASQYAAALRNRSLEPNEREKLIPVYLELLCDLRRCIARGNSQILADNPAKLAESFVKVGQQVHEIEEKNPKSLTSEVRAKFTAFLNDYPAIKAEYKTRGGKAFLD